MPIGMKIRLRHSERVVLAMLVFVILVLSNPIKTVLANATVKRHAAT
jgi:hypothetical protein